MNQALIANPAYLLALPYSSFTAGAVMPRSWGLATVYVWDPTERTKQGLKLDRLFSDGIIVGTQVKVNTNFFDLPGEHHVGGIWKNVELTDLARANPPGINFPGQAPPSGSLPVLDNAYTLYYGFDQYVQVFPGKRRSPLPVKPPRGWGVFGRASISDGNPTPFEYFLSAGIGGDTRFAKDRGDTFGVGWFHNGVTKQLGATPAALLGRRDGWGVEAYYRLQLTPWLAVTPDVQYIKPGFGNFTNGDNAFVYGIRVNMNL
jgi:porin